VKLCIGGHFIDIVLDDLFPCIAETKKPSFSKAKGPELWVLLLEKAWAKINGNYENTILGTVAEAIRALTGAPIFFHDHESEDDIWTIIKNSDRSKYVICASAGKKEKSSDEYMEMGLVSNHAYAIIWADEIDTDDGKVKLMKMRNPWGHKEW
jgi:calpain-15